MTTRRVARCALAAALTTVAGLGTAAAAEAAFPGRSGDIAVDFGQSDRGGGFTTTIDIFDQGGRLLRAVGGCRSDPTDPNPPAPTPCPNRPAYSPSGREIAYAVTGQNVARLAIANADGSNIRVLRRLTDADLEPAYSPSEGQFAFTGVEDGRKNVYIVDSDGTDLRQLTRIGGRTPAWSSRNRIAYVRQGRLYSIDPDGSHKTRLRRGDEPDYSPQGDRIVYQRTFNAGRRNEKTSLFILRSAKRFRPLTRRNGTAPAWSPGGGSIAFNRVAEESGSSLMVVRINRTGLRTVVPGDFETGFNDPSWQPLR